MAKPQQTYRISAKQRSQRELSRAFSHALVYGGHGAILSVNRCVTHKHAWKLVESYQHAPYTDRHSSILGSLAGVLSNPAILWVDSDCEVWLAFLKTACSDFQTSEKIERIVCLLDEMATLIFDEKFPINHKQLLEVMSIVEEVRVEASSETHCLEALKHISQTLNQALLPTQRRELQNHTDVLNVKSRLKKAL
jgi:hypothetical protein